MPVLGIAAGLFAAHVVPVTVIVISAVMTAAVVATRAFVRQLHPQVEWDDPAPAAVVIASLGAVTLALAWVSAQAVPFLHGAWFAAWPALAAAAVAGFAASVTLAAIDPPDPFAEDPRRASGSLAERWAAPVAPAAPQRTRASPSPPFARVP